MQFHPGTISTPKYRIEFTANVALSDQSWYGAVTLDAVAGYVERMNTEFQLDAADATLSALYGTIPYVHGARIVRQADNAIMVEYSAPTYRAV